MSQRSVIGVIGALCLWVGGFGSGVFAQGGAAPQAKPSDANEALLGWPFAFQLPENLGGAASTNVTQKTADLLVWTPPGAKRIRSVFLIPNNSDSKDFGQCRALRDVAVKAEMGIVYMRRFDPGFEWELKAPPDTRRLPELLNYVSDATGIAEFRYAPWIPFGKSSRGSFPYRVAWLWPDRTIASVTYHGETPTWPVADWARLKDQTILEVNANGETEWGGTWFVHVRPSLLNYRAQKSWLAHQVVAWGVGHGDYPDEASGKNNPAERMARIRIWEYLALFIGKANELRVPKDKYATEGAVELKTVDEAGGYLIDPFAVEELFFKPRMPLSASAAGYLVGAVGESPVSGYVSIDPAPESVRGEGVPVSVLTVGRSPSSWLVTEGLKSALKRDPMTDLGDLGKLQPKPGDKVRIDDVEATFAPLPDKWIPARGGIALGGLKRGPSLSFVGYTVLEVTESRRVKLNAPFSVAGRHQIVLNGVPVAHKEVVDLRKGLYPMLVVLSLNGVSWGSVEPLFEDVTGQELDLAKAAQAEKVRRQVEQAKLVAAGPKPASTLIRKATDVPKDERKRMFWVADREQAEAWFRLHALKGQTFDVK